MNLPNLQVLAGDTPWVGLSLGRPIRHHGRLIVSLLLVVLAFWVGDLGEVTREQIVGAYTQVSVFVAFTLLAFYGAERFFGFNLASYLKQSKNLEVPIASLLGATPGCGGAILVVAAYTSGNVSFGAVVATLIATMGDAAFLLIAVRPDAAIVVLPISFVVAVLCGFLVNGWIPAPKIRTTEANSELAPVIGRVHRTYSWYLLLLIPGLFFGICGLLSVSLPESFDSVALILSLTATAVGLFIWTTSPVRTMANCEDHPVTRMAVETSFISVWVLGGFLAYEYLVLLTPINIAGIFTASLPYLPLFGILVGFIPGCGPQVLVTTLYINGLIPFGALIGNAISNDGDALFPALAINPKAATLATLYSAIPALLVGYGFYFFLPSFLN